MVLPIAVLILLSNRLTPLEFGIFSLFQVIAVYAMIVVDFGLSSVGAVEIAKHKSSSYISQGIYTRIVLALIFSISFYIINSLVNLIPYHDYKMYLSFLFISLGYSLSPQWFLNGHRRLDLMAPIYIISRMVATLLFMLSVNLIDISMLMLIFSLGILIPSVLSLFQAQRHKFFNLENIEIAAMKNILVTASPIAFSSVSGAIFNGSLLILVGLFYGAQAVGPLAIADRIVRGVLSIFAPLTNSLLPATVAEFQKSYSIGLSRLVRKGIITLVAFSFVSGVTYTSLPTILEIFGNNSDQAHNYTAILLIWAMFSVANNFFGVQYFLSTNSIRVYTLLFNFIGICLLTTLFLFGKLLGIELMIKVTLYAECLLTILYIAVIVSRRAYGQKAYYVGDR